MAEGWTYGFAENFASGTEPTVWVRTPDGWKKVNAFQQFAIGSLNWKDHFAAQPPEVKT